jgi:hypothetical protein
MSPSASQSNESRILERPAEVRVYGADHSPWVQAVLLGLHDAGIAHTLTTVPPLEQFLASGVTMPAASIDGRPWQLESAGILRDVGYDPVTPEELGLVRGAWRGVLHRADSAALFFGAFSLAGDPAARAPVRLLRNLLRSFVTLYFFLVIRSTRLIARPREPTNYGDQFLPFEALLSEGDGGYLGGAAPGSLDLLLFGIIQCHCSIHVPPVTALQTDPRLGRLRAWIASMHERFRDYPHLYSGSYFAPHSGPPARPAPLDLVAYWLGVLLMIGAFPVTAPLIAFLALRNRRA